MEINERRGQANRPIGDLSFRNAGFRTALYMYGIMLATLLPAVYCTPHHTPFPYPVGPMIVRTNLAETIQLLDTRHGSRHRSEILRRFYWQPGTIREEIDLLVVSSSLAVVPERAQWKHDGCELFFGRSKSAGGPFCLAFCCFSFYRFFRYQLSTYIFRVIALAVKTSFVSFSFTRRWNICTK